MLSLAQHNNQRREKKEEIREMINFRSMRFRRSNSKLGRAGAGSGRRGGDIGSGHTIEWEMRPGGMLVQKRDSEKGDRLIKVRVSMGSHLHDISIGATSTFGELKMMLSLVTGLEPREQRLLYRGKERDDGDHLHMVGLVESDKVLLLEDPAAKERKLRSMGSQVSWTTCSTIVV